ncbi:hypothetical protein [Nostoc sp. LPT]|uniref:hypothetical protein n=1 Tax=Nostoc sp. LPT TaxID=2815387 RepID=UPI001DCE8984|nr:hypothetical protein [Nostoc sp. LPT]MBN4000740.1 hypothetical protein [Nostoc sp. LPT]
MFRINIGMFVRNIPMFVRNIPMFVRNIPMFLINIVFAARNLKKLRGIELTLIYETLHSFFNAERNESKALTLIFLSQAWEKGLGANFALVQEVKSS